MSSLDFNGEAFVCRFKQLNQQQHYYKKPKLLPCGKSACVNCIVSEINQNEEFECRFCGDTHQIHEITPNVLFERIFVENLSELVARKVDECKSATVVLKVNVSKTEKRLDKIVDFIENEIEIRFESIKIEIEQLNVRLLRTVDKVERKALRRGRKLGEIQYDSELIENARIFERNLKLLKKFAFQSSTLMPNYFQIGYLNALNILNVHKIKTNAPQVVDLKKLLKYPTCMCSLNNEKLILTDNQQNEICVLDSNFKVLQRVSRIADTIFNGLRGIATNARDSVYICDAGNDRVIVADINLKKVKRIIGRKGKNPNEFDWPTDVCFYNDSVFVLDEINYRVQRFNSCGDFMKVVYTRKLTSIERSNIFKKISVDNNLIAISNRYFVFLIDFEGNELQKLGNLGVSLKSIFLTDNYIVTHNSKGSLACYGSVNRRRNSEEIENEQFSLIFERSVDLFKKPTSCIIKFDDKLLLVCMCDNLLISL